jgi:hypothetical protein
MAGKVVASYVANSVAALVVARWKDEDAFLTALRRSLHDPNAIVRRAARLALASRRNPPGRDTA